MCMYREEVSRSREKQNDEKTCAANPVVASDVVISTLLLHGTIFFSPYLPSWSHTLPTASSKKFSPSTLHPVISMNIYSESRTSLDTRIYVMQLIRKSKCQ